MLCHGLNFIRVTGTHLLQTFPRKVRNFSVTSLFHDLSLFVFVASMINLRLKGEIPVKVGVMEFGLKAFSIF